MLDTHCHIDLYANPNKIIEDSVKNNCTILSMTNLPSHFEMGLPHFNSLKKIRVALGMHPLMAIHHKKEFNLFVKNFDKTSYIGEVGLDFSAEGISTKEIQLETFSKILKLVSGQKKILSIHSRKAEKGVLELLVKNNINSAIFHWYSGGLNLIKEISEAGFYFSINPAMIRSASGRKIISKIPKSLVLTETDGPFISQNGNILKPGEVESVLLHLAKEWNVSAKDIEDRINSNFSDLIKKIS